MVKPKSDAFGRERITYKFLGGPMDGDNVTVDKDVYMVAALDKRDPLTSHTYILDKKSGYLRFLSTTTKDADD